MTWTHAGTDTGASNAAPAHTHVTIGNLLTLEIINTSNSTVWASSISGGGATWVAAGVKFSGTTNAWSAAVFLGTVTATGSATPTITWSGTAPANFGTAISEFHSSVGSWTFDKQGNLDSAGTTNWPSLTASSGAGELYYGYAANGSSATPGSTSGYVYNGNIDTTSDGMAYNLNCPGTATFPVWADSNQAFGIAVLISEGGGGGAAATARSPASPGKTWLRRFRHRQYLPPLIASGPVTITGTANLAAAVSVTTAVTQSATAAAAGAGSVTASAAAAVITGLAGGGNGYFTDQYGKPRFVLGDAAWAWPGNAGRWNSGNWQADFDTFAANRAAQGFTVIYCKPIGTTQSGNLDNFGKTFDALYPFQGGTPSTGVSGANPSTGLTASFWARIDYMLASAAAKGITVFLNAIGYSSDFDSGPGPLAGKSGTEFTAYGTALGGRYAATPNLVWNLADDYFSDNDTLITAFLTGLTGAGDTHTVSIENLPESDSRNTFDASPTVLPWGTAHGQYNFCYSYNVTYVGIEKAYAEASPLPVIQGDGYFYQGGSSYAGGSGAFAYDRAIRQDAWHAATSGARGIIHGSESIWQYGSTSLANSSTDWYYVNNAGVIRSAMESLTGWQNLIPDTSSALVTAGRGTHATTFSSGGGGGQYEVAFTDSYVTASRTPDGSLAVVYLSHGTTITIDQTKLGSGYTATWIDPVSGATSSATPGSTYNSTAKGNNSQGDPDWVLAFQGPPLTATGTATIAGAGSVTAKAVQGATAALTGAGAVAAVATVIAGSAPAGAGSVTAKATQIAPATVAGAGAVTAAVTQAAGASPAGAGSVTDVVTQIATASLAGAGAVTAAGTSSGGGTATAAGAGSVTAVVTQIATAAAAGAGAVTAAVTQSATAAPATAAAVTAKAVQIATANLAGAGSVTDVVTQIATAAIAGAGSVTAAGISGSGAGASITGAAVVTAAATIAATASLAGAGAVTTAVTQRAAAAITAAGSVTAAGAVQAPFTVGALTGTTTATSALTTSAAPGGTSAGTITTGTQRTGGPS